MELTHSFQAFFTVFILCLQFFNFAYGLDIESAKESVCFDISKTASVDLNWVGSVKTWYNPLMSRLDLYYTGVHLSGKTGKELQEDELYYDSCIEFRILGEKFVSTSFGGKQHTFNIKPIKGVEIYEVINPSGSKATAYTTLTDNKTFIFNAICMDDNQMTWTVISTKKSLPKETVKQIHDHAESLGFNKEFFTGLRVGHCKGKSGKVKNEL